MVSSSARPGHAFREARACRPSSTRCFTFVRDLACFFEPIRIGSRPLELIAPETIASEHQRGDIASDVLLARRFADDATQDSMREAQRVSGHPSPCDLGMGYPAETSDRDSTRSLATQATQRSLCRPAQAQGGSARGRHGDVSNTPRPDPSVAQRNERPPRSA